MCKILFTLFVFISFEAISQADTLSEDSILITYSKIQGNHEAMPKFEVFRLSLIGYKKLGSTVEFSNDIITIIDYSLSSNIKRMWVVNLSTNEVLFHNLVAHGRNSGNEFANKFSNVPETRKSSLGFFKTGNTYYGKHGYSLYLHGLEKGINGKAKERSIVMHGADYVNKAFILKYGRLGRSFGCPAVSMKLHKEIIDTVKNGTCLFIYHPNSEYKQKSKIL